MSKQLEELKARIAEHTKKHPQIISHKDLKTAPLSPVKAKVAPKVQEDPIEAIEDAMDALEDSVEDALNQKDDI